MSNTGRSRKQAAKDKAALKRLQKSGKYRGKIDLRKAPTKYQLKKIEELSRAKSKPPSKAKRAKRAMPPKTKTPGAKVKRSVLSEKEVRELKPHGDFRMTTYALPFLRKGQEEPEWRRFTGPQLTKFLNEYKADDPEGGAEWKSYAVKETWVFDTKQEKADFRRETDVFFSGVRIDQPQGTIKKRVTKKRLKARGKK